MSYVRFGEEGSDVYVYPHASGGIECCACALEGQSVNVETPQEMIDHLDKHRAAGHHVPKGPYIRLRSETQHKADRSE